MFVFKELVECDVTSLPGYDDMLRNYFPKRVREAYPDDILNHMLSKEIAATVCTTQVIADAGAAFVPMTLETSGHKVLDVMTAYLKAQQLARTNEVRSSLEELRLAVEMSSLYKAWVMVDSGVRELVDFWLSAQGRIPNDDELEEMTAAVDQVYALQASEVASRNHETITRLQGQDIPEEVALRVLKAQYCNVALMVWSEAKRAGSSFPEMVVRHLAVARASRLQEVLEDLATRPASGQWDPIALNILHSRFHKLLRLLVGKTKIEGKIESVDALEPKLKTGPLAGVRRQVDQLVGDTPPAVATLLVLEERVSSAISRMDA
jgi:glutamate dehydrogenase